MAKSANNGVLSVVVGNTTRKVSCPAGCKKCHSGNNNAIVCLEVLPGYSFDNSGNIMRCADSCKACSPTNSTACTACFGANRLIGTTCTACTDKNAVSCSASIDWSDSCVARFTPVNGTCTACAENCKSCPIRGAGNCDDGGCG